MRIRPQKWVDRFAQYVGRDGTADPSSWPVPVAIFHDGRGISSREATPYQTFSVTQAAPTAGNHWAYTFTPSIASRELTLRISWGTARLTTVTSLIGVRIGAATTKASSAAIFPIGDANTDLGGAWTADQILAANVPVTLYNLFLAPNGAFFESGLYPEYFLEAVIAPGQVLELICRTVNDVFDLRLGYFSVPDA